MGQKTRTKGSGCTVIMLALCVLFILLAACNPGTNDILPPDEEPELRPEQKEALAVLDTLIQPFDLPPLSLEDDALAALDDLKDARVVGLGGASYGSKEFFEMMHRIFKYLVQRHGFRALAFECDFADALFFDKYITTGKGNLEHLLLERMHFWGWKTREIFALLEWMKDYNQDKAEEDMIRFWGLDCESMSSSADLLAEYLADVSPGLLAEAEDILEQARVLDVIGYSAMPREEWDAIQAEFQWLFDQIAAGESEFAALSSRREYEIAKRLVWVMIQAHEIKFILASDSLYQVLRHEAMAENALWIANLSGENGKVALWSHNQTTLNSLPGGYVLMGNLLKEELGEGYQIVALLFSIGEFYAVKRNTIGDYFELDVHSIDEIPDRLSINFLFHHAKYENFILDLDKIPAGSALADWLTSDKRAILNVGYVYDGIVINHYADSYLTIAYDMVLYFDTIGPSELLF